MRVGEVKTKVLGELHANSSLEADGGANFLRFIRSGEFTQVDATFGVDIRVERKGKVAVETVEVVIDVGVLGLRSQIGEVLLAIKLPYDEQRINWSDWRYTDTGPVIAA